MFKGFKTKIFNTMHQDIIQRFQFTNSTISINDLNDKIKSENLSTKLIHLNNGEIFNINSNEINI